jgi:hypothetical protein
MVSKRTRVSSLYVDNDKNEGIAVLASIKIKAKKSALMLIGKSKTEHISGSMASSTSYGLARPKRNGQAGK